MCNLILATDSNKASVIVKTASELLLASQAALNKVVIAELRSLSAGKVSSCDLAHLHIINPIWSLVRLIR